ncbi:pyruvate, phosphate dikinase, partial [Candidatus Fermentibacterales bacterium]|nr:pyruvate, phosphate dikinase [Candidatus Fermentibacterales bacterium]
MTDEPVKYVYLFSREGTDGNKDLKDLLGGKGANLAEMTLLGLPVPPGFTISTEACEAFYESGREWPEGLEQQVRKGLELIERASGKALGDPENPLLLSVRSGAAVSMPGMMDTVLNLGMNELTLEGLARKTGNPRFAWDSYRRFQQMFGDVVMGIPHERFEAALQEVKDARGAKLDTELDVDDLMEVSRRYGAIYRDVTGAGFPEDPWDQLVRSVDAVFRSWNNARAVRYRELNEIRGLRGTAVNVQTMVFGNMGEDSATGVCFTRDPSQGRNTFYGEYLLNAQGEDVVAGIRTPLPIESLRDWDEKAYSELLDVREKLEKHYLDMQDLEFTIEGRRLYILQTRTGKRTIFAALNMAVDMVDQGLIDRKTAVMRVPAAGFPQLFAPILDTAGKKEADLLTTGLNASPGGACGKAVFTAEDAERRSADGEDVILCRLETSPEDIGGMAVSRGILTARGGMTSHAAVVARGMGIPCVAGASELSVDSSEKVLTCGGAKIREGDVIAIDGFTGEVFAGEVRVRESEIIQVLRGEMDAADSRLYANYARMVGWADELRTLGVRTNADTPRDTRMAVLFGAEGVGLCRTEHMFFAPDRIRSFRKMILVADTVKRLRQRLETVEPGSRDSLERELAEPLRIYREALEELLPLQRQDFYEILKVLEGRPCTIRLLDPPLHEFLPGDQRGQEEMAVAMGVPVSQIEETVERLEEFNPMLGHRGCRLGLTYPEVSDMQVRAAIEAAVKCRDEGIEVRPEIMIPLVGHFRELKIARERAQAVIDRVLEESGKGPD